MGVRNLEKIALCDPVMPVTDYLQQEHDGWEINDGSYGEFTIIVAKRKIELHFNARFTDFHRHTKTF